MFKDLKEYQDITKIYQDSVNISEEEREIIRIFKEENFTEEELIYVLENFDELYDSEIDLTESLLNEEELQEIKTLIKKGLQKVSQSPLVKKVMSGAKKKVTTGAGGLKQRMSAAYDKNIAKGGINKLKSGVSNIKKAVVGKLEKAKPMIKKGLDTVKKFAPVGVAGAAGFIAGKMSGGDKKPSNTDASGKVIPSTASIRAKSDRVGGGNAGASTDAGLASTANMPKATPVEPKKKLSGKERAQAMAKARIKSGKTIQQVKDENKASMIANARQRNVDFKAKRRKPPGEMKSNFAGGVSGKGKATDDFSKDPRYQSTAGTSTDIKKAVNWAGWVSDSL